jgi:cell wall-associated NlpC family hydrolase
MNFRFSTTIAAFGCVLLASCYPYDEGQNKKQAQKTPQKTPTAAEQQKIKEQRESLKEKEDLAKKEAVREPGTATTTNTTAPANPTTPGETAKPPTEEKRADYAVANPVPGKPGYVFSPYNNKLVDVRDIPSGTLVQDPTYTGAGKGYFRVP